MEQGSDHTIGGREDAGVSFEPRLETAPHDPDRNCEYCGAASGQPHNWSLHPEKDRPTVP